MENKKYKDNRIVVLRFLACLLITNSHCGDLYPISLLAIGGGQGNVIFFVLSGYCLANINIGFREWIKRRANRILPATIIFLLLRIILIDGKSEFANTDFSVLIKRYVDLYWFVFAILLYYVIFYFAIKGQSIKKYIGVLCAYALIYIVSYVFGMDLSTFCVELEGFSLFKVLFYFGPFFSGGIIRKIINNKNMQNVRKYSKFYFVGGICGILVWAMEYIEILIYNSAYKYQFLIHLGIYIFGINVLLYMLSISDIKIRNENKLWRCVQLIGDSTLSIYLMQVTFKPLCIGIPMPFNFLIFWLMALIGGCIYTMVKEKINKRIEELS